MLVAAGVGFALLYGIFREHRRLVIRFGCAFAIPVSIAFLSPYIGASHFLIGLTMLVFFRERSNFAAIYVFGMMTLAMVPQPIAIGSLYLLDFSFGNAYTIGALLGFILGGHARQAKASLADIPVLMILSVLFVAAIRDSSATNALREFLNYVLSYLLPYYIVSRSIQGPKQAQSVMLALAGSAVILSTIAIFEVWRSWPLYRGIWAHYGIQLGSGASVKLRGGLMRSPGPYSEPLSLAFAMTIGIIALLSVRRLVTQRWHYMLLGVVVLTGLIAPQSRGAWIGALFALFALDLYRRKFRSVSIKAVLLAIAGLLIFAAAGVSNRIATVLGLTNEGKGTMDYREQLLARGIEEFWKHPLFGDSIGNVLSNLRDLIQGEGIVDLVNGYLHIALISGGAGLFVIMTCFIGLALIFWQTHHKRGAPLILRDTTAFAFASLIAIATMLTSMSIFGRPLLILFMILACGAGASRAALLSTQKIDGRNRLSTKPDDDASGHHFNNVRVHETVVRE